MSYMFYGTTAFNQPLGSWNTTNVTNMKDMFSNATAFNQPLASWNTAHVTHMNNMFSGATAFDQNLAAWNVTALTDASGMFSNITLSTANYDALLNAWEAQATHSNVAFDGGSSHYCNSETARSLLISADHWSITDGGKSCADAKMGNKVKALNLTSHRYTLKVTSIGSNTATSLTVTDTLPKNYRNIQVTSATASCQKVKRTITCTLSSLAAGSTATIQITATDNGATGKNCASVTTKNNMNLANNSKCVNVP